ncbi:hypothetical protein KBC04_01245 [Candidatus Babeliales bacterium]|nr:hypothetical protein [Candidatus Babeliales bacterium]MBP9843648.1 hypothetical protein [Candidatus Babeliales bacterium]
MFNSKKFLLFFVAIIGLSSIEISTKENPHQATRGHLLVICGSMKGGKSDEFIRRLRRRQIANPDEVGVFKHAWDNRVLTDNGKNPNTHVSSRSGSSIACIGVTTVAEIEKSIKENNYITIGIDEAQFFNKEELLIFVRKILAEHKEVIIAGLDLDFRAETFGAMGDLLALADEVIKLKAICAACKEDRFCITQRNIDGQPAHYDDPIVMVGESSYDALCRNHHQVLPPRHNQD